MEASNLEGSKTTKFSVELPTNGSPSANQPIAPWLIDHKGQVSLGKDLYEVGDLQTLTNFLVPSHIEGSQAHLGDLTSSKSSNIRFLGDESLTYASKI